MDYHNYVVRAYHVRRRLTSEQRKKIYRMRRIRTSSDAYVSVDTLFHLPEVYLYLALVDFYEDRGRKPDYRELYQDVRDMIDEAHADGSLKSEILKDPGRFVSPDPRLGAFLMSLRESGRKVFLLTNSERFYTDTILSYLLESDTGRPWRSYFDVAVVDARKPRFFLKRSEMTELVSDEAGGAVYSGGDVWKLEKLLGHAGDGILYWGDHTYGDILRSKKSVGWRTAMIVPELESEIAITRRIAPDLQQLAEAIEERDRAAHEEHVAVLRAERLEAVLEGAAGSAEEARLEIARNLARARERLAELRARKAVHHDRVAELDERCNAPYNKHWGTLFREGNEITRFGHQIKDFACIYTSRVSNFLHYPANTYFRAPMDRLPHEL
jgi:HAD superfamily 5'-nucleotidase-like hydrolase